MQCRSIVERQPLREGLHLASFGSYPPEATVEVHVLFVDLFNPPFLPFRMPAHFLKSTFVDPALLPLTCASGILLTGDQLLSGREGKFMVEVPDSHLQVLFIGFSIIVVSSWPQQIAVESPPHHLLIPHYSFLSPFPLYLFSRALGCHMKLVRFFRWLLVCGLKLVQKVEPDLLGKFLQIGKDASIIFGHFSEMFADSLAHLFCPFGPKTIPFQQEIAVVHAGLSLLMRLLREVGLNKNWVRWTLTEGTIEMGRKVGRQRGGFLEEMRELLGVG